MLLFGRRNKRAKRKMQKKGIPYVYNRKWRDPKDLKSQKMLNL